MTPPTVPPKRDTDTEAVEERSTTSSSNLQVMMILASNHPELNSDILLHAFGSACPNPGSGGWAFVWRSATGFGQGDGAVPRATNVHLTMKAIVEGLLNCPNDGSIAVCTDSEFLVESMRSGAAETWRENGWRRLSGRGVVKNADLWAMILEAAESKKARIAWLHGHVPDGDWDLAQQRAKFQASVSSQSQAKPEARPSRTRLEVI